MSTTSGRRRLAAPTRRQVQQRHASRRRRRRPRPRVGARRIEPGRGREAVGRDRSWAQAALGPGAVGAGAVFTAAGARRSAVERTGSCTPSAGSLSSIRQRGELNRASGAHSVCGQPSGRRCRPARRRRGSGALRVSPEVCASARGWSAWRAAWPRRRSPASANLPALQQGGPRRRRCRIGGAGWAPCGRSVAAAWPTSTGPCLHQGVSPPGRRELAPRLGIAGQSLDRAVERRQRGLEVVDAGCAAATSAWCRGLAMRPGRADPGALRLSCAGARRRCAADSRCFVLAAAAEDLRRGGAHEPGRTAREGGERVRTSASWPWRGFGRCGSAPGGLVRPSAIGPSLP